MIRVGHQPILTREPKRNFHRFPEAARARNIGYDPKWVVWCGQTRVGGPWRCSNLQKQGWNQQKWTSLPISDPKPTLTHVNYVKRWSKLFLPVGNPDFCPIWSSLALGWPGLDSVHLLIKWRHNINKRKGRRREKVYKYKGSLGNENKTIKR